MRIYIDTRDWWVGYYRGPRQHYVCLLPCVVIRWRREGVTSEPGEGLTSEPPEGVTSEPQNKTTGTAPQ